MSLSLQDPSNSSPFQQETLTSREGIHLVPSTTRTPVPLMSLPLCPSATTCDLDPSLSLGRVKRCWTPFARDGEEENFGLPSFNKRRREGLHQDLSQPLPLLKSPTMTPPADNSPTLDKTTNHLTAGRGCPIPTPQTWEHLLSH